MPLKAIVPHFPGGLGGWWSAFVFERQKRQPVSRIRGWLAMA